MNNEVERALLELTPEQQEWLLNRLTWERESEGSEETPVEEVAVIDGAWPLSSAQQRLWLIDQLDPGNPAYHMAGALCMTGELNIPSLKESLDEIIRRHHILRTVFAVRNGEPVQKVRAHLARPLFIIDLRSLSGTEQEAKVRESKFAHARRQFDLSEGPLLRGALLRLSESKHVLLLAKHHIISDGWSLRIFAQELTALYRAFSGGRPSPLPELAIQYTDFSLRQRQWLQSPAAKDQLNYWTDQLGGILPKLDLPTDYQRPLVQTNEGSLQRLKLAKDLSEALRGFSKRAGATLYMTLLAAFKILLYRYSGQEDLLVGTSIANRNRTEVEGLIGYFVNTLVFRTDLSGDPSFEELLGRVRKVALEAYSNQDLPFERLLEEMRIERDLSHTPIFQVFFNMLNYGETTIELPALNIEFLPEDDVGSKFDLTLYVKGDGNDIQFELAHNPDIYCEARASEILRQLEYLLSQIVGKPEQKIAAFSLDTGLALAVRPDPTEPLDAAWIGSVHTLFEQQAERSPMSPAVKEGGGIWTYEDLNRRSNQIAHYLITLGVQPQTVVAIYGYRNADLVCAVLGVLKAGAVFIILDPAYPAVRLIDYLKIARPRALLCIEKAGALPQTLAEFMRSLGDCHCVVIHHRTAPAARDELSTYPATDPGVVVGPDDIACIGFTSGSTGRPKGVLERHGPLTHFLPWQVETFGLHKDDRYSMLSGLSIDLWQREVFTPLCLGASICIPQEEELGSPQYLTSWMRREEISIAYLTPAMSQILTGLAPEARTSERAIASLRYVFIGGDMLTRQNVAQLRYLASFAAYINSYGATETQRAVAMYLAPNDVVGKGEERKTRLMGKEVLPVGRGIRDTQLLILNSSRRLAGIGEVGEICFRSPHLARGYIEDEALTRERFIDNHFTGAEGDRLYRTGDLGRYLLDGSVELLGRADQQVKIRGFRIEPGEVETVLRRHQAVQEVVVMTRTDHLGDKRLVAYIVPRNGRPDKSGMHRLVRECLPNYMIPSAFVMLESLPVAPSGKVDRRFLPDPDWASPEIAPLFVGPRNRVEASLARLWAQVLGLDSVGAHDNFFELGGHSLIAIKLLSLLNENFGIKLPLRMLFERPTVAELALAVAERQGASGICELAEPGLPTIEPDLRNRYEPFPLTDVQQAYWVGRHAAFELGNVATHTYLELERSNLDLERFNFAWQRLIERHEMLRAIVLHDGRQQILERPPSYRIEVLDLRGHEPLEKESELQAIRQRLSHQVLQADCWPLFEIRVSRLETARSRLHISFDLLIGDAWSFRLLIRELLALYENPELQLPELVLSFRDYVLAERALRDSTLYQRSRDYWLSLLPELPPAPELPVVRDPGSVASPRFTRRSATLEREKWMCLKERAAREGITGSVLLLAVFAEVLATWSKSPRFTINLTLFNRLPLHAQIDDIVGDFTSLMLLSTNVSPAEPLTSRAKRLQDQLWENLDHRYFSGVQVMRELARVQKREAKAVMPIVFTSTLDLPGGGANDVLPSELGTVVYSVSQTPQVWLDQQVFERAGALVYNWDAVDDLFPPGLVADMFDAYGRLLEQLATGDLAWVETTRRLTPSEQIEQREKINGGGARIPAGLLHSPFTQQAASRPREAAVIAPQLTLSYEELNTRSLELCEELKRLGARPNSPVAIVMEKGWEQVVAVIGVLYAGAPYLPLDPQLPRERLWQLLSHGQVNLVLTQSRIDSRLSWPPHIIRLCIDSMRGHDVSGPDLEPAQSPSDLAYLIYTSGSTGQPKGVMIEHHAAANTIFNINERLGIAPGDRSLAISSLSFDLSVYDIFGTLAAGGTIVMPEASEVFDPARLARLIVSERVTVWNSTPALMRLLVDHLSDQEQFQAPSLRVVLLSGDWIPVSLPERIKRLAPGARVISLGGATEASIWSIYYSIEKVDVHWRSIPYGLPLPNQSFHVLNEALNPCPVWVTGQLYIGGLGLARGYWRDEERTRLSFITHPGAGERLYRTGDLGRYLPDGNIEFLGREDFQVKVNGYRIEPEEIETALAAHPSVVESAVVAQESPAGDKRLVAFVVPGSESGPASAELREFLAERLPIYMIPSAFMRLDALPLTPNGKVDRKGLINLRVDEHSRPVYDRRRPEDLSERISQLVAAIIGADELDADANLLDLGANSVDVIRIANALERDLGFRPSLEEFYRLPTVGGLAKICEDLQAKRTGDSAGATHGAVYGDKANGALSRLIVSPAERERFKRQHPGLRSGDEGCRLLQLPMAALDEIAREKYASRRSYRQFSRAPIGLEDFGRFLGCLRQIELNGEPKYLYASAGGLYPVQTYLYTKASRVEGIEGGVYYYHPVTHRLVSLTQGVTIDENVYGPFVNRPIFREAAFSIYLIAQLSAIAPLYGDRSLHFATLEAGYMSQQLMLSAMERRIGLCPIGTLDFDIIRELFALDESHVLIHSLLGGSVRPEEYGRWTPFQEPNDIPAASSPEREEGVF